MNSLVFDWYDEVLQNHRCVKYYTYNWWVIKYVNQIIIVIIKKFKLIEYILYVHINNSCAIAWIFYEENSIESKKFWTIHIYKVKLTRKHSIFTITV